MRNNMMPNLRTLHRPVRRTHMAPTLQITDIRHGFHICLPEPLFSMLFDLKTQLFDLLLGTETEDLAKFKNHICWHFGSPGCSHRTQRVKSSMNH